MRHFFQIPKKAKKFLCLPPGALPQVLGACFSVGIPDESTGRMENRFYVWKMSVLFLIFTSTQQTQQQQQPPRSKKQ